MKKQMKKKLIAVCFSLMMLIMTPCMALAASEDYYTFDWIVFDMKTGARGNDVARVQQRLIDLGYLNDRPDGSFGPNTAAAIKEFQRMNGIHGESGYAGVATGFTQARLFSDDVNPAWSSTILRLDYNGNHEVYDYEIMSAGGNSIDLSFTFVNKEHASVTAVKFIYWLEDYYGNLVPINGYSWYDRYQYGFDVGYNEEIELSATLTPSSEELSRAGFLRMMVAEIAYSDGEVYITCDPSTDYNYQRSYITGWA